MDVLTNVIDLLRIQGHLYGSLEFTAPWAYQCVGAQGICLIVTRGTCLLEVAGQERMTLTGGDFVLLLDTEHYVLRSDLQTPLRHILTITSPEDFERTRLISGGGGGVATSLIAGGLTFTTPGSAWLIKHLPPILHLSGSDAHRTPWLPSMVQIIAAELAQNLPGASTIVDRLAEVLFVQAVRTQIQTPRREEHPNWLRALADPQIGESLRLLHADPGHPWTVPELAGRVSMSRSAFAARFRKLVGDTPLSHLTWWRMIRAAGLLHENPALTISEIASSMGYESDAAFGKVFRRVMGATPGIYRRDDPFSRR